jgi:hypothetical protein
MWRTETGVQCCQGAEISAAKLKKGRKKADGAGNVKGRTFSPAAEFFGWSSRKFLKLVGNTRRLQQSECTVWSLWTGVSCISITLIPVLIFIKFEKHLKTYANLYPDKWQWYKSPENAQKSLITSSPKQYWLIFISELVSERGVAPSPHLPPPL